MKLTRLFDKETTLTFVKVEGSTLTVLDDKGDVVVVGFDSGELPKGTITGSKLIFSTTGELVTSSNPEFKPAVKTGRTGCLEQRVQG